jgi:signal transduction histidine kinase
MEADRLGDIAAGVVLAAIAAALQLALSIPVERGGLLLFLAAVLVSSHWWSRLAGLAATAMGVTAALALLPWSGRGPAIHPDVVALVLLGTVGLGVAWWTGSLARGPGQHESEARRLKDEFLATVSHELRTPLNAILGWIQLLRLPRGAAAPELERGLEVIERNAKRQLALVEDLLAAVGPIRSPDDWQRIELHELVLELTGDLAETATAASVALLPSSPTAPGSGGAAATPAVWVLGDRASLRLALRHVLTNAIKFTPSGGRVWTHVDQLGGSARVVVSDTGEGIEPTISRALFEPFRQRDGSATRAYGGLGLGLTVAQRLVEAHRGGIAISSDGRGRGSTVVVTLPAITSAIAAARMSASASGA